MEAGDTPTPREPPSAEPPPEPRPPAEPASTPAPVAETAPGAGAEAKAGGGWRALGVLLGLVLLFAAAVMFVAMAEIADTPLLDACRADPTCTEYFDGSSAQRTIAVVFGFISGGLAAIGALAAFYFAATGHRGRLLLQLTGAAIAFGALSILIGSV